MTLLEQDTSDNEERTNWSLHKDVPFEDARAIVERQTYIEHDEPICNGMCGYRDPHRHGLPCHKRCECRGICHPTCPAYEEDGEDDGRENIPTLRVGDGESKYGDL